MSKDKDKDKEYLVDKPVDTELTEEELAKLRTKKTPGGDTEKYKRQDLFGDRRDPFAPRDPSQPERRGNRDDRREKKD